MNKPAIQLSQSPS